MKYCIFCLAVFALTLFSCSEQVTTTKSLYASDTLTTDINVPTIMKLKGGTLLLVDMFSNENLIKIFDANKKTLVTQLAQKGHGPSEFLHISSADFSVQEDTVLLDVFDPVKKILTTYNVNELLKGNEKVKRLDFKKASESNYTEVFRIDGGFIATGLFSEGKYAIFDDSLKYQRFEGEYLSNASGETNIVKQAIANNGTTVFSSDRKHFVQLVYMASVLSFYTVRNLSIHKEKEYMIKPLNYKVQDDHIINNEVEGYLSASYGKKHIYTLYCGTPESDGIATYGKEIHVFSLDGELQEKYVLDISAFQICVNEEESKLYVLSHEPRPCVLIYDL